MRLLISSTSSGVNVSFDGDVACQLTGHHGPDLDLVRIAMSVDGETATIKHDPRGATSSNRFGMFRGRFLFDTVKGYPKHGPLVFGDGGLPLYVGNRIIKFTLPKNLPPHTDIIRKGRSRLADTVIPNTPASRSANLVMTVGDMTLCYNVPDKEMLELTFSLAHKGYAIR